MCPWGGDWTKSHTLAALFFSKAGPCHWTGNGYTHLLSQSRVLSPLSSVHTTKGTDASAGWDQARQQSPVIPELGELEWEDGELEAILGYVVRP